MVSLPLPLPHLPLHLLPFVSHLAASLLPSPLSSFPFPFFLWDCGGGGGGGYIIKEYLLAEPHMVKGKKVGINEGHIYYYKGYCCCYYYYYYYQY